MPKEIELEEEEKPKNRGGRPRKTDADIIFGDEVDPSEERRLAEETEIQNMLQREDANTTTIIVSRRMSSSQKFAHLSEIGIRDYSREDIANQYGGGQYRCRIRRSDGQFGNTWYFDVDMSRKPENVDNVTMAGTPTGVDAVRLVETMAEKFGSKANEQSSRSDDIFKLMITMQQENTRLIAGMMQAMAARPQPTTDTALTQMSTMLLKHSLDSSHNRMEDVLNTMTKLKKLTAEEVGDEEPEEGGSFIKDVMSAIPQIMKQVFQPQPQQAQPLPTSVPAPMMPMAPVATPATMAVPEVDMQQIGMALAGILQQAEAGVPPVDVYRAWAPLISEENTGHIKNYLRAPNWFENLSGMLPGVADKREWFEAFRKIILTEEVEVEAEEQPKNLNGARRAPKKAKSKKD